MAQETTPERFQRMEELFHQVQSLPADEQQEFLDSCCIDDAELKADVESLLAAAEDEGSSTEPRVPPAEKADRWLGRVLGNYRIDSLLGRGGMGAVYLASRNGGEIAQQVAIKVMGSRLVSTLMSERFKSERQVLASLNHPNIARLLDGGISDSGELYLVMEFVDGPRLDHYVEQRKPALPELLALFLQVCAAVDYAHRNLVVHRDLKPGNILMTSDGQAKLLDFGTATLVNPKSAEDRSRFTQMGFRACTPEYASPEQLAGGVASAASDVYSLGVILYQLITARTPYDLPADGQLFDRVRNKPPRAPSQIRRGVGADLDAVVLKALMADPEERYPSVAMFAGDLRRVLESRPVSAREQTRVYRAKRLLWRRRFEFAGGALVLAALAAGLAATSAAARVARAEEQRARQGVRDVRSLTRSLLFEFYDAVRGLPGSTDVQKSLVTESLTYLDRLQREAPDDTALTGDVVEALARLGNLQSETLHEPEAAEKTLRKAVALANSAGNARLAALAAGNLGKALVRNGKGNEGVQLIESSTASMSQIVNSVGSDFPLIVECASLHGFLGNLLLKADPQAAEVQFSRQAELNQRALKLVPQSQGVRQDLAGAYLQLAGLNKSKEDSIALVRSGLRILNESPALQRSSTATMRVHALLLVRLAMSLSNSKDAFEAALEARRLFASAAALEPLPDQSQRGLEDANRIISRTGVNSGQRSTPH